MDEQAEITITVSPDMAEAYRKCPEDERRQMDARIRMVLAASMTAMRSRTEALTTLRQTMDSISQEAIANGLTPEILDTILHDAQGT
jgi:hypothetical protein